MTRIILVAGVLLVAAGCDRPIFPSEPSDGTRDLEQSLVLAGFNAIDTVVVGTAGYRVGRYHDFSPYDSLSISFSAEQLAAPSGSGQVVIRVGPADYFTASFGALAKEVTIHVDCADLPKPHSSALTFYAADPDVPVLLANLRVVGWWSF